MIREIKFRGQTRRKGEYSINVAGDKCDSNWVYGGIFPQNENEKGFALIYQQTPEIKKFPVYADTVGQYLGIKDKNGKEIYEKDIVFIEEEGEDGYFVVEWDNDTSKFVMRGKFFEVDFDNYWGYEVEVVGNVFDTPKFVIHEWGLDE